MNWLTILATKAISTRVGPNKLFCPRVVGIALDSPLLQFWQVRASSWLQLVFQLICIPVALFDKVIQIHIFAE